MNKNFEEQFGVSKINAFVQDVDKLHAWVKEHSKYNTQANIEDICLGFYLLRVDIEIGMCEDKIKDEKDLHEFFAHNGTLEDADFVRTDIPSIASYITQLYQEMCKEVTSKS